MGACASAGAGGPGAPDSRRFKAGDRKLTSKSAKRKRTEAYVCSVTSGTTFVVKLATSKQKVQMQAIEAVKGAAGARAKKELSAMINAKTVDLDIWEKKGGVWLCDVSCKGVDVQAELVKNGLARVRPNPARREMLDFEKAAQNNELGVWASGKKKKKKSNNRI